MTKSFSDLRAQVRSPLRVVETGTCLCHCEPRGDAGLEGYQLNDVYRYALVKTEKFTDGYYRVYPSEFSPDYYETCSKRAFTAHFKITEVNDD